MRRTVCMCQTHNQVRIHGGGSHQRVTDIVQVAKASLNLLKDMQHGRQTHQTLVQPVTQSRRTYEKRVTASTPEDMSLKWKSPQST